MRRKPLRLFAFHHAGGTTTAFAGWQSALGPDLELVPVPLPGRGPDGLSTRYHDTASLLRALAEDLAPQLAEPHLMYGHSMGAAVAHRLALLRTATGYRPPERLLVASLAAPRSRTPSHRTAALSDTDLRHWLLDVSRVPATLLDGTDLLDTMLTRLRADLRLCTTGLFDPDPGPPLPCPIDVLAGTDDPLVPLPALNGWADHTTAATTLHLFPGGHFFPRESKPRFFTTLRTLAHPTEAEAARPAA